MLEYSYSYLNKIIQLTYDAFIFFIALRTSNFTSGSCPIDDGTSGSCPIDDGTSGSCPIDDAIHLADNGDGNDNDNDNDKHDQFCQTEEKVLSEGCYQTDPDMAQLDRQQIYLQHITDELSSTEGQLLSLQLTMESFTNNDEKTSFIHESPHFPF